MFYQRRVWPVFLVAAASLMQCAPPGSKMDKFERGYCFAEQRYFSDRELEDIAFGYIVDQLNSDPPSWYDTANPDTVSYSKDDLERFRQLNPDAAKRNFRDEFVEGKTPKKIKDDLTDYDLEEYRFQGFVPIYALKNVDKTDGAAHFSLSACGSLSNFEWAPSLGAAPRWVTDERRNMVE